MDRAFASGSSGTPPSAPGSPSIGYPTAGNPGGGTPPTKPGPYWYHMITEELRAIITAAGLTPAQGTVDQVLQALPGALASRPEMAKSLAASGYQKLPGGLILQWGSASTTAGGIATFTYPVTFPNACLDGKVTYSNAGMPGNATLSMGALGVSSTVAYMSNTSSVALSGAVVRFLVLGY